MFYLNHTEQQNSIKPLLNISKLTHILVLVSVSAVGPPGLQLPRILLELRLLPPPPAHPHIARPRPSALLLVHRLHLPPLHLHHIRLRLNIQRLREITLVPPLPTTPVSVFRQINVVLEGVDLVHRDRYRLHASFGGG